MLAEAECKTTESPFKAALRSRYDFGTEKYPSFSFTKSHSGRPTGTNIYDYSRYWHGYLVFLKPLLFLTNLTILKCIIMMFQFPFMRLIFSLHVRRHSLLSSLPILVSWLFMTPVSLALGITYSMVFSLTPHTNSSIPSKRRLVYEQSKKMRVPFLCSWLFNKLF